MLRQALEEVPPKDARFEFIRKEPLKARRGGRIPALALTANGGSEDRRKALAAGFDLHVPKPAEPAKLVAKLAVLARGVGADHRSASQAVT